MVALIVGIVGSMAFTMNFVSAELEPTKEEYRTDYNSVMSETKLTLSPGDSKVLTAELLALQEQTLNLRTGIALEGKIGYSILTDNSGLPDGVSVTMDKSRIDLTNNGYTGKDLRSSVEMTLNISEDAKPGTYELVYFVYEEPEKGVLLITGENIQLEIIPLS